MDEKTRVVKGSNKRNRKAKNRPRLQAGKFILRMVIITALLVLVLVVVGGGIGLGFVAGVWRELPSLEELGAPRPSLTSFVYSADGEVLTELHRTENRIPISLDEIPVDVQNAFVAAEDHRFWDHRGADPIGIVRAMMVNIQTRSWDEGASTITQQVVKNAYTHFDKDLRRKVQDAILAFQMERRYTKAEILEMYLNFAFFGHDAYGIQVAAQTYFGKDASRLTVAEGAMLAGLLPAANAYSPYVSMDTAVRRQHIVLGQMVRYGFLTEEEAAAARNQQIRLTGLRSSHTDPYPAPHFTDYVIAQLVDRLGSELVYEGGLQVYTTVDMRIQRAAETAVSDIMDEAYPLDAEEDQPEMAAVVINPHTGEILAMVGGRTHTARMELNRVVQAYRQPGSAFKPVIPYAAAVDMGFTAASIVDDAPIQYPQFDGSIWAPMNYDFRFRGLTPFRDGLQSSINVMAVRLLDKIGVRTGIEYAERLGITSLITEGPVNDLNLAIALGGITRGVSPLELTSAFGVFATDGVRATPFAITKVLDQHGNVIFRHEPELEVVLRPGTGYIISDMLVSAVEHGTGRNARTPPHTIAGKTGTTSDHVDAWFVGYSPDLACGVWMGHDQPKDMGSVWGGTYAARVFSEIMSVALEDREPRPFPPPSGLVEGVRICTKSGLRPGPLCPPETIRAEKFLRGTQPQETCNVHVERTVCRESGLLATDSCPPSSVVTRVFIERSEPWEPYTDQRGRTFAPADAVDEVPTDHCDLHAPAERPGTGDEPGDAAPLVVFEVSVDGSGFDPNQLSVPRGTRVLITLVAGDEAHGIVFPDFGVYVSLAPGETTTLELSADTAGHYRFFCPADDRLSGVLIVTD